MSLHLWYVIRWSKSHWCRRKCVWWSWKNKVQNYSGQTSYRLLLLTDWLNLTSDGQTPINVLVRCNLFVDHRSKLHAYVRCPYKMHDVRNMSSDIQTFKLKVNANDLNKILTITIFFYNRKYNYIKLELLLSPIFLVNILSTAFVLWFVLYCIQHVRGLLALCCF